MLVIRDSLSVVVCLCTVVLLLLAGSGRAAAGDSDEGWVFVSNVTGNDTTGDGTRAKPFETVTKALTVGPQVRLLPNAPSTPYPKITLTAGMADAEYKFVAEEGPQVTQLEAFESQGKRFLLLGLTLNNPFGTGITATNNVMADIRNCVAAYCAGDGVAIAGGIVNITNCVLYSNVYGFNGTNCTSVTVYNTIATGNSAHGIRGSDFFVTPHYCYSVGNTTNYSGVWVNDHPIDTGLAFVDPANCNFQLKRPSPTDPGLFHQGTPALKNPDGSRSDLGAFGGPDSTRWFRRGPGTRPVISAITTDKTDAGGGNLKVTVRMRLSE